MFENTAIFWIEENQYTAKEGNALIVTIHRAGNLANADELSKLNITKFSSIHNRRTDVTVNQFSIQINSFQMERF